MPSETVGKYKYWNILEKQWFDRYFRWVFVDFFSFFSASINKLDGFYHEKKYQFFNNDDVSASYSQSLLKTFISRLKPAVIGWF